MNEEYNLSVEQSDSSLDVLSQSDEGSSEEIEVYVVNDTYSGTISETYLDYFRGIVEKLKLDEHYLVWRSGQYEYTMAYGEQLSVNGYVFTGSDLWVTTIYRENESYSSNYYISHSIDDISVDCSSLFVYSDLGEIYPTLKRGWSSVEATTLFFAFCVMFVFVVVSDIFKYVHR